MARYRSRRTYRRGRGRYSAIRRVRRRIRRRYGFGGSHF